MGWLVLGSRPAGDRGVRSDSKEVWKQDPKSECPSRANGRGSTETEVPALMKVLIRVDPHKASVAGAVVDEAGGELVERASFPQNRAGLRSLERWAKRFPERRWAVENASGFGRHLAGRLAAAGETLGKGSGALDRQRPQERWARCPRHRAGRLAQRAAGGGRSRDWLGGATSPFREARGPGGRAYTGAQPPPRAFAGSRPRRGDRDALGPPGREHPARHTAPVRHLGPPPPAVGFGGAARRPDAGRKDRGPKWAHRSRGGSLRHHPHRDLRHRSHTGREDHRYGRQRGAISDQGPLRLLLWHGACGGLKRGGGAPQALAGRQPQAQQSALHMVAVCQARSDDRGGTYYRKKIAEGKSRKEALRCLKRCICDAVYRSLVADSQAPSRSAA